MTIFTAYKNELKTFRVQKSNLGLLGPDWQYNWDVIKVEDPLDKNFYRIEGVDKEDESTNWSYDPFVSITFLEPTSPGYKFRIVANVKIITNGIEVCEPILVGEVYVIENENEFDCGFIQPTGCIISGNLYTYTISCSGSALIPEYVDFYVSSGSIFSNGQYFSNLSISPVSIGETYQAHVQVRWNELPTSSDGFSIYGVARKGSNITETYQLTNLFVLPNTLNFNITGLDTLLYNTGLKEYVCNATHLDRFPTSYNLRIYRQIIPNYVEEVGYLDEDFTLIYDANIVSSQVSESIFINTSAYQPTTEKLSLIFKVVVTNEVCDTTNIFIKDVNFVGCIDRVQVGDFEFSIETCPSTITEDAEFILQYDTEICTLTPCTCSTTEICALTPCTCSTTEICTLTPCECYTTEICTLTPCFKYCNETEICSLSPCTCTTTEICTLTPCECYTTEICSLSPCFKYCNETEICSLSPCTCTTTEICSLAPCQCYTTEICSLAPCQCYTTEICSLAPCSFGSAILIADPMRQIELSILPGTISPTNESKIKTLLLGNFYN